MKTPTVILIIGFLMFSCGGSLSDEQRKAVREKMDMNKIVRVTEVEIMEAAFKKGRNHVQTLEKLQNEPLKLDSFLRRNEGSIRFMQPGQTGARDLEQQLMEAYLADEPSALGDNLQKVRDDKGNFDSLLYTKPVMRQMADGSKELRGVWNIWLSKKELVLEASKHK